MVKCKHNIEYESLKETVDEANEIISELNEENEKLNEKIIDLSADLGFFQNENIRLTEEIEEYWQLEEELRCPLEVVFKALKDGIVIKHNSYVRRIELAIYNGEYAFYSVAYSNTFYLKDYQKTWWLKGEKDE